MVSLNPLPWLDIGGRLLLAVGLGASIGFEREYSQKSAGLRTNMLVSLGSAMFVLIALQSGLAQAEATTMGRVIQGVIAGVGFIGAGTIFQEQRVRGLTSAAAIWVSAAMGLTAGLGLWQLGLMGIALALAVLRGMKWLERQM